MILRKFNVNFVLTVGGTKDIVGRGFRGRPSAGRIPIRLSGGFPVDRLGRGQALGVAEVRGARARTRNRRVAAEGRELAEHGREVGADLCRTEERRGTRNGEFGSKVISDFS